MADNKIFRESALDTVSNPEQLDQHIRVTRPFSWVILIAICSLVIGVGVWACIGNISNGIDIVGIMFSSEDVMISNSPVTGTIVDVLVSDGDRVDKSDVMLVVSNDELLSSIEAAKVEYEKASAGEKKEKEKILDNLRNQYALTSFISAHKDGVVSGVPSVGEKVEEGTQVLLNYSSTAMTASREIIAYVPYSTASMLNIGSEVQISPENAKREEFGYILGRVTSIGTDVVTEESIIKTMGTMKYVNAAFGGELTNDCVEVRIKPNIDTSTKSKFEWSNKKGADNITVKEGAACQIKVVTEELHPINLIIGNLG